MKLMRQGVMFGLACLAVDSACAKAPDCAHPDQWPATMALVQLKNAGTLQVEQLDLGSTVVKLVASERLRQQVYRQVHLIRFIKRTGGSVTVMTVNEASGTECSLSAVEVYVVAGKLGDDTSG